MENTPNKQRADFFRFGFQDFGLTPAAASTVMKAFSPEAKQNISIMAA